MDRQAVYSMFKNNRWTEVFENVYLRKEQVSVVTDWEAPKATLYTFDWVYDRRGYAMVDVYRGSEFKRASLLYSLKIPITTEGVRTGKVWKHHRLHSEGRMYGVATGLIRMHVEKEVCKSLRSL